MQPKSKLGCTLAGILVLHCAAHNKLRSQQCMSCATGNTLPPSWAKAWLGVNEITLRGMSGPIPSEWTAPGAFPLLTVLDLANNQLSGAACHQQ